MHEKEIQLFTQALKLAKAEFYIDSLKTFQTLIDKFPESELVDDSYFNIGLCYFNINHFERAKESFEFVISNHPDATISILDRGNEYGRTAAKCFLGVINCYLGLGNLDGAKSILVELKEFTDSFIILPNGEKEFFYSIGKKAIEGYINFKQKK
jgi:tetratricopeptide (TPR) repeat protein